MILASPFFDPSTQDLNARLTPNSQFAPLAGTPSSDYVYTNGDLYTGEPGPGTTNNFPGGGSYDDLYNSYNDQYYFTLCGPGAADVTLFDWPWPPNDANYSYVFDSMIPSLPNSSWNGTDVDGTTRTRGYMVHLAFQIQPPTWSRAGMLPQTAYQTGYNGGATLQTVQDALNWEASGENSSNWSSYFYTTVWNSSYYNSNPRIYPANLYNALHSDVVTDISVSHVPVIVEIDASNQYLPNWPNNGSTLVKHFVAIVGYDDNQGTYTYIDTCKQFTNCNGAGQDQPDLHVATQSQLEQGVALIGTNMSQGDGGWVW
ncbi:MAG: hypothetical protein ACHQ1E_00880 [Ktedonobacterales bacterium]|jgi:hypothetical protein